MAREGSEFPLGEVVAGDGIPAGHEDRAEDISQFVALEGMRDVVIDLETIRREFRQALANTDSREAAIAAINEMKDLSGSALWILRGLVKDLSDSGDEVSGVIEVAAPEEPPAFRPTLLRPEEAAERTGVDVKTLARYARRGLLKEYKTVGGHRRYSEEEVRRAMEEANRRFSRP